MRTSTLVKYGIARTASQQLNRAMNEAARVNKKAAFFADRIAGMPEEKQEQLMQVWALT